MSSDLLRRAAKTLREVSASCEPGDWTAELGDTGSAWVNLPAYTHAWGMHGFAEEARHVVLMHPPVALALAEALDSWAEVVDGVDKMLGHIPDDAYPDEFALARAILREQP